MKIIANVGDGYLVEATADDLSNLMGFSSNYRREDTKDGNGNYYRRLKIGDNIPIHAMFDRLFRMANLEKELVEVSAKLKAASDFVNTALPVVGHINSEAKP
jgi:hypothetical protein